MSGGVIDVVVVLLLLAYAVTGFRQGLIVSVTSLVGFLGAGALAMWLLPSLLGNVDWLVAHELWRVVVLIVAVFVVASIGQGIAVGVGRRMRSRMTVRPVRAVDSVLGAAATVVAVSLLVWFVAGAARSAAPPTLAKAIGESQVLRTIDTLVPPQTSQLFAGFRSMLDRTGIPRVFDGISPEPIQPAEPPDPAIAGNAAVMAASRSVVKITGVATACNRGQEGSGWVVSEHRVVTNAHVVAGMTEPQVQVQGVGRQLDARVVVFDPDRDLAVLDVPDLTAVPLTLGGALQTGDEAVVAGFPLDGPLRLDPARVRRVITATGSDIYGQPGVERQIFSLYSRVEPGNSGGPLLGLDGRVVGVVFAKSLDDSTTGYALTLEEAEPVLSAAGATTPVSTGACSTG